MTFLTKYKMLCEYHYNHSLADSYPTVKSNVHSILIKIFSKLYIITLFYSTILAVVGETSY